MGAAVVAVRAESGCATHQCDKDTISLGDSTLGNAYRVGDAIVWESAGATQSDAWLDYTGARTYALNWAESVRSWLGIDKCILHANYDVANVVAYVATDRHNPTGNFVEASGQLAEMTYLTSEQVNVTNGTCAEYFLRVVVELVPKHEGGVPDGGVCDGGSDGGDAVAGDAASDVSLDSAD
jgi:hypothetical protein